MSHRQSRTGEGSPHFYRLMKRKKRFLAFICLTFLTIYFLMPILIAVVPEWMNQAIYGSITIAWVYAVSQCLLTLLLASLYIWKARQFDRLVRHIVEETESGEAL